jgi:23S rRNA (guanine2445-N2)-methyltransferase / 23S rRNA (guanine2069-N7)-methyltransferase
VAESFDMIAKTFFGLEQVLADELAALGAEQVRPGRRMCAFQGTQSLMYRANLACRTAVRVLKPIHCFSASCEDELYRGVGQIDWRQYLDIEGTLAIDPVVHSLEFGNSLYAAQLAKDAIVDQLRTGKRRPAVDLQDPQLRINLHIDQRQVTVYLDASGDSLHKRGYRAGTGEAPINEVLAAGILRLTGWDQRSPLADFMCGSGTFVIEAALWARRIAPGLLRKQFGYMRWKDFSRDAHDELLRELRQQVHARLDFPIQGSDLDASVVEAARGNARRAGVEGDVRLLVDNFEHVAPPAPAGMLVTNPPYDERLKTARIAAVYRRLGDVLKQRWGGYDAFIFTGNLDASKQIGLRSNRRVRLFNGPIECRLIRFPIDPPAAIHDEAATSMRSSRDASAEFVNRLTRMSKHWHRWARRAELTAYRLYDRDLPEVPLAIDWYAGSVLVGQYARPHNRTEVEQRAWLGHMLGLIASTLDLPRTSVYLAVPGGNDSHGLPPVTQSTDLVVRERTMQFHVRLGAGKATGLAIDRRKLRARLSAEAAGQCGLSLWAGGGTMSVALAAGGALSTVSVERSPGLVSLAERNFGFNGLTAENHHLLCQDPLEFVAQLDPFGLPTFDLIVVEAPGFDGKRREGVWNVQDGHAALLSRLLSRTSTGGRIYFVTPFRRMTLRAEDFPVAHVREITRQTVPQDFRDQKVHRAWLLTRVGER